MPNWNSGECSCVRLIPGACLAVRSLPWAGASRRVVDVVAAALWGSATGILLSIAIRSEPEYRLASVGVVLTIAFLTALILAAMMLVGRFRETGEM